MHDQHSNDTEHSMNAQHNDDHTDQQRQGTRPGCSASSARRPPRAPQPPPPGLRCARPRASSAQALSS
eukprot:578049-Rhodomonas_salina.3